MNSFWVAVMVKHPWGQSIGWDSGATVLFFLYFLCSSVVQAGQSLNPRFSMAPLTLSPPFFSPSPTPILSQSVRCFLISKANRRFLYIVPSPFPPGVKASIYSLGLFYQEGGRTKLLAVRVCSLRKKKYFCFCSLDFRVSAKWLTEI